MEDYIRITLHYPPHIINLEFTRTQWLDMERRPGMLEQVIKNTAEKIGFPPADQIG